MKLTPAARELYISIHPPREGWDANMTSQRLTHQISIHPPREGWDRGYMAAQRQDPEFQSTHPARGGTKTRISELAIVADFNPPTPRGVGPRARKYLSLIHI